MFVFPPSTLGTFGLGPRLAGGGNARIFHHAGANDSYKAYIEGRLDSGDGLVVITNGRNGDVLGDEIRNAVSDALGWTGDWSVKTSAVAAVELFRPVRRQLQPANRPKSAAVGNPRCRSGDPAPIRESNAPRAGVARERKAQFAGTRKQQSIRGT
ncbi:hypothetical protein [Frateuria sp. STR12]|uniref:hypothetical protein n=1 Tax=Frateuria hangzhouensis TaxID=2995589 RepID=UPI002260ACC5|nr:hypothetical protein [Frateuria sp. STR12]MCX7513518.1 hypothetical protein [Frateuria sp. STR12]